MSDTGLLKLKRIRDENGNIDHVEVAATGRDLLNIPALNKGSAFTHEERKQFNLIGELPNKQETLQEQVDRFYQQYMHMPNNLQKYIFLSQLYSFNITAFYKLVEDHLEQMLPVIYTPTVGEAVQNYSLQLRRPRGVFINYHDRDYMDHILRPYAEKNIDFIIVTDGEAVLGLGDQGVGGMDISIGKLMVYIVFSGLDPTRVLPVFLDVGTNNEQLLHDPFYLGIKQKRITGRAYYDFIDKFVNSVKRNFPSVFLHWEDFSRDNARCILEKYQNDICTFNDDMQGTGIVTSANIISAVKGQGLALKDQVIVMHGAGTASCGIADQIADLMAEEGISLKQARKQFWILNSKGLLTTYQEGLASFQKPYMHDQAEVQNWKVKDQKSISLEEVVYNVKPTILIGCSTAYNAFTEKIVKQMAQNVERPIIMPLSNPVTKSEAHPHDLIRWTEGKAIIATGSPYPPYQYNGSTYYITQGNNAYIFPGLGLGVVSSNATRLTNGMIRAATHALSELSPFRQDPHKALLPTLTEAKSLSRFIARAVAEQAVKDGVSDIAINDIDKQINHVQWDTAYYRYKLVNTYY